MATIIWCHFADIKLLENVTPRNRSDKVHVKNNDIY